MGHLNVTTSTTLLLAFFTITCQTLVFQSQASGKEEFQKTVSENSIIQYPLAIANDHRGSGR